MHLREIPTEHLRQEALLQLEHIGVESALLVAVSLNVQEQFTRLPGLLILSEAAEGKKGGNCEEPFE